MKKNPFILILKIYIEKNSFYLFKYEFKKNI